MNTILYSFKIESQSFSGHKNSPISRKVESTSLDDTVNRVAKDLINKGHENISVSFKKTEEGIRNPKALQNFKRVGKKWEFIPKASESSEGEELESSSSKGKEKATNKKAHSSSSQTRNLHFIDFPQELGEFILDYSDCQEEFDLISRCKNLFLTYISHLEKKALATVALKPFQVPKKYENQVRTLNLEKYEDYFEEHSFLESYTGVTSVKFGEQWILREMCYQENFHFKALTKMKLGNLCDTHIEKLSKEYPGLKKIDIRDSQFATDRGLPALAKNCTSLESLKLEGAKVTLTGLLDFVENCPSLKTIKLVNCLNLDDLKIFSEKCSKNTYLDLSKISLKECGDSENYYIKNSPLLKTLKMCDFDIIPIKLINPLNLKKLIINISFSEFMRESKLIKSIQNLSSLKTLKIYFIDEWGFARSLEKNNMTLLFPATFIENLTKYIPNLKSFSLDLRAEITDKSLEKLSQLSKLKTLSLINCEKITDQALMRLLKKCRKLKNVSLHDARKISDQGMNAFALNAPRLKSLSLTGSPFISLKGITELALSCHSLEYLDLKDSQFSEGYEMNQFQEQFPKLRIEGLKKEKIGKKVFGKFSRTFSKK